VSQGKGLTPDQARISAVMEAVETACAERCETLVTEIGSVSELEARDLRTVPFERLLRAGFAEIDPRRTYGWVAGRTWPAGGLVHAPYELVGIDYRDASPWDHETFHMSSIGLAAHTNRDAALRHALLEVIENDATATLEIFGFTPELIEPLPELTGPDELILALEQVAAAGLDVRFCLVVGALDLPVVGCFIGRHVAGTLGSGTAFCAGFACRPRAGDAALAALLEAVQSRLTDIAGARDDIAAEAFEQAALDIAASLPPTRVSAVASAPADPSGDLALIRMQLRQAGIGEAFVFDLAPPGPLRVVRVLVADLQAPGSAAEMRLGLTATRQLLK
jgi:ribosomal protein S12 methylthiotransferase accessory factor